MSERIVCKPTPWFLLRAALMLAMFGVFTVLFYMDGKTGYREKNLSYYVWQGFDQATKEFAAKQDEVTPESWKNHAATRTMPLPEDLSILPAGTPSPMPWPPVLHDFERMKAALGNPRLIFDEYRLEAGITVDAPEHPYDAGKISEQWVVFWICLVLTLVTAFVLVRTLGRSMVLDETGFQPAGGPKVPFENLFRLDLRKWDTKGLAYAWAKMPSGGERRLRIDGLTYGGFKKEQGEPAEVLMRRLRERFSGEIVEYVTEGETPSDPSTTEA